MNTNWRENIRFHNLVITHPELEDKIKKFYLEIAAEYEKSIVKLNLKIEEFDDKYDDGYDDGVGDGERGEKKAIIKDLRKIKNMEELQAYIDRL